MRYAVTLRGGMGTEERVVEAATGDEAAAKAYKPGCFVIGVHPAPADESPQLKAERRGHTATIAAEISARDA